MTELLQGWLYEAGIGENRALRVEQGELAAVRIERDAAGARPGAIVAARFTEQWVSGQSGIVTLDSGEQCLLQPLPKGLTEGSNLRVEVVREAIHEQAGQAKRAKARPVADDHPLANAPTLLDRLTASAHPVQLVQPHDQDQFAGFGWHEAMEQAQTGRIDFDGGSLLISLTPAMTVIDVDGPLAPVELARRAAKEVAHALTRLDISGSIGIDFPTLEAKRDRSAVADIFDEAMTGACERTAINGFGFMQVVARKSRPSILEIVQSDKLLSLSLALLRQAERSRGAGPIRLAVHPAVAAKLNNHQPWLDQLAQRTGRPVMVEAEANIAVDGSLVVS